MSSDEPKRSRITRNLRLAYGEIAAEPVPEMLMALLKRMDDGDKRDPDPDSGIAAEPPARPKGGPKSDAAAALLPPSK